MIRVSIRYKLLLVILTLLLIPWMGYQYVREMKSFALQGQEEALLLTAGAIATVLHDRPELFSPEKSGPAVDREIGDLQVMRLDHPLTMDGKLDDWGKLAENAGHYSIPKLLKKPERDESDLSFNHVLGSWGRYLYALFIVQDDRVIYRDTSYRRLDNSDHLRIYLRDENDKMTRYAVVAAKPGRMDVYAMDEDWRYPLTGDPIYSIVGYFRPLKNGYAIELRIPRDMVSGDARLAIAIADVDDPKERKVETVLGISAAKNTTKLGKVLIPSPEIDRILHGLDKPGTRIWVIDQNKYVRALVGDLSTTQYKANKLRGSNMKTLQLWMNKLLKPVFRLILNPPVAEFKDLPDDTRERNEAVIYQVLEGKPATDRRPSIDKKVELLMAAHPIFNNDKIMGAVIVERSSNNVVALQNQLLQNLIAVTVIVFALVGAALMTFAWRLTRRIRRLSMASGHAINPEGRLRLEHGLPDTKAGDEIGDLSRSISDMLTRLAHYTRYLERMPDTLAHELNNPLNVVNSSLENLGTLHPDIGKSKYMSRARNGVNRLGSLLASLTEAGNLEEALESEHHEKFNLNKMLAMFIEGYKESHPEFKQGFITQLPEYQVILEGSPDHIAQMMDKLLDNAMDFCVPGQPVSFSLSVWHHLAIIKIMNIGKTLPEGMEERLFDPMISLRQTGASRSHLGMGLHIVRLIANAHGGTVAARNNEAGNGVVFEIRLPFA
ncbi:sensor histidine kinase YycG [bacterium BMS3Bbin11]|nr:sensor histidine kinase YycG [bacterium BMS3Abin11]GBE46003.1 sensor histidine kinase YycG [bacterium BMS3Bbin11]GMT40310.1 MAG: proteobacterial dedicated sortase system histidine kinase [bacterium]HDH08307.1 proteobacterial dedicated sortase system histidine kinase [Gammaproteobacteria bacterium]HDH16208.1 proteobacterial dedicated sortase system histidine kinase [Gammaproteobacteria bacterium]